MPVLTDEKRTLRSAMLAWRAGLGEEDRRAAAQGLVNSFRYEQPFEAPLVVSGAVVVTACPRCLDAMPPAPASDRRSAWPGGSTTRPNEAERRCVRGCRLCGRRR